MLFIISCCAFKFTLLISNISEMNSCFVTLEGFQLGKSLIVKELHLLAEEGEEHKHFVFLPPTHQLSIDEQRIVRYSTRYIHGFGWYEGDVPYYAIEGILRKIQNYTIFSYGYTTCNFLRLLLPATVVIDTQKEGYAMPKVIPTQKCFREHTPRHCAKAKAHVIRQFVRGCEEEKPRVD